MRQKIVWSTTTEKIEQRKIASNALSKLYEIEWQVLESAAPPLLVSLQEQSYSESIIYLFELDSDLALEQCRVVRQTFKCSQEATRSVLLIGLLTETDIPKGSTFPELLPILDGIITQSNALADELALITFTPIKCLPLPETHLKPERHFFIKDFAAFIKAVRLAKSAMTAMAKVSDELLYIGVEDDAIVIDSVAKVLSQFWS
jgi:hypothetical protein